MRILHVGLFLRPGAGHVTQLGYEATGARELSSEGTVWVTHTLSPGTVGGGDTLTLPRWATRMQLAKFYTWRHILRQQKHFDVILMRSVSPDPFAVIFAPLIRNLYTVHHTKEIEELRCLARGFRRTATLALEGRLKSWAFRNLRGVIGVTDEIAEYESRRFPRANLVTTFPNGIDYGNVPAADDARSTRGPTRAVFIASHFYEWHGLDILLNALAAEPKSHADRGVVVDLVGSLTEAQAEAAADLVHRGVIRIHGTVGAGHMRSILSQADVAIASLALERKGLSSASTLKVREYLAAGVPVYSTHHDAGLPSSFPYYCHDLQGFDLDRMAAFANGLRTTKRTQVRNAARRYVSKTQIMRNLVVDLRKYTATD